MAWSPNQKIDGILRDIRKYSDPFDQAGIRKACQKIAAETLRTLNDRTHQLAEKYDELKAKMTADGLPASTCVSPNPTHANPTMKSFWPLQFLLHLTGLEPKTQTALASHLGMSPSNLQKACKAVPIDQTVEDLNYARLTKRLITAVEWLRWPDAEFPFRVEHGNLIFDAGPTIKLSKQEATLLETLTDHPSKAVSHADLQAKGVTQPVKRLSGLNKKLSKHPEVAVNITADKGTLTLRP